MDLELISFKLCPYMQSSLITLLHNGIKHKLTYIDINDPPEWFDEVSPTGQVPLLRVNTTTVIFESSVINEYLNEQMATGMLPTDPLQRAQNRAWTQFCGGFFGDIFNLLGAVDAAAVEDIEYDIHEKLDRIEAQRSTQPFFNGEQLCLIDAAYAALFMRLDLLKSARDILDRDRFAKLAAWSDTLLGLDVVQQSVTPEFAELYTGMVKMKGGWIGQNL